MAFQAQLPRDARQVLGGGLVGALPPKYLSVEGHQKCLGSHQASESHRAVCIPATKPGDCNDDAWTELKNVFEGDVCRGGRDDHVNFPKQPPVAGTIVDVSVKPGEIGELKIRLSGHGGGIGVRVLVFFSDDPSFNPT